jgi:hypothetical protein
VNPSVNTGDFACPTRERPVNTREITRAGDVQESKVQGPRGRTSRGGLVATTARIGVNRVRDGDRQDACPTKAARGARGYGCAGACRRTGIEQLSGKFFPKHPKMGVPPVPGVPRPVNTGDLEYTPFSGRPFRVCRRRSESKVQTPRPQVERAGGGAWWATTAKIGVNRV